MSSMRFATTSGMMAWLERAAGAYSTETERSFRTVCLAFSGWCEARHLCVLPAEAATLAAWLPASGAPTRRATPSPLPWRPCASAQPWWHGSTKRPGRRTLATVNQCACHSGPMPAPAEPIRSRPARSTSVWRTRSWTAAARDLAIVLVGRDLPARASELVSLELESVRFQEDGTALLSLRREKTDTARTTYPLGTEAAAALRRWLDAAGIISGLLFVSLTKGGKPTGRPLSNRDVGRIMKALAGEDYSAHSRRRGMAHDLVAAGLETGSVMQAGGWKSPTMIARYTQDLAVERSAVAQYHASGHK